MSLPTRGDAADDRRSTASQADTIAETVVDWDGPADPTDPFNWPRSKKLMITVVGCIATFSCNANATALTVAWHETNAFYGISDDAFPNSYWPVASWTLGGVLFMLLLLPLIEDYSVRWGYLISYLAFIIFTIPQGVVQSFAGVNILRFLAGGCVSLVANCICGICCDIWAGERSRLIPVASYVTAYLCGPAMGPVLGAAILTRFDWTWIIWLQVIWNSALLLCLAVVLDETRGVIVLRRKAAALRQSTGRSDIRAVGDGARQDVLQTLSISIRRPAIMFISEYVVFSFTFWSAFAVGMVYMFTQSTELVFSSVYGWNSSQCGYVQASIAIGMLLAWVVNFYSVHLYFASASRNSERPGTPIPEAHLYVSVLASFVGVLGGMFVYGWTAYSAFPWIAPAIGLGMVGFGINSIVITVGNYVTACYSRFAISAVACVGAGENLLSALLPLATMAMYARLGVHWPSSILGLLSLLLGAAPVVILFKGKDIRARSPFILEACYEEDMEKVEVSMDATGVAESGETLANVAKEERGSPV